MVRTERWKYIEFNDFRPMLFDLENDPQEQHDLGAEAAYQTIRDQMRQHLVTWSLQRQARTTMSDQKVINGTGYFNREKRGVLIGYRSEEELMARMKEAKHVHDALNRGDGRDGGRIASVVGGGGEV